MYAAFARGLEVRDLAVILGESALSDIDLKYLEFAKNFEQEFIKQDETDDRSIEETLDLSWKLMSALPKSELKRVKDEYIEKYLPKETK